jgi:Stress responsive A/B Barrel Domain
MIRHIVLVKFKETVSASTISSIFSDLAAIKQKLTGVLSITSGKSESPEKIERGYLHGFIIDFVDWQALQTYQDHPDHKAVGARLVENSIGGIDGILVFDLAVEV